MKINSNKEYSKFKNQSNVGTERVFARQLSRVISAEEAKQVSGGVWECGWTDSKKHKAWDCGISI